MVLAVATGADVAVVRVFGMFRAWRSVNEFRGDGHGARCAEFARKFNHPLFSISEEQMTLLYTTCRDYTDVVQTQAPAIGACRDAEARVSPGVGIKPRIESFNAVPSQKLLTSMAICMPADSR